MHGHPRESRRALSVPPPARSTGWLTLLGFLVALGTLVLGAVVLLDARRDAWQQAVSASTNLVVALEGDIARTVATYDLSLLGAADAIRQPGMKDVSPELRHLAIFDRAAKADYLGSLLVLDEEGSILADSTSVVPHRLNFGDRDYFAVHRDRADAGLYVSRPFRSRLRGGDASIAISRRLSRPDGGFAGVVVGTLRLAYFDALFARLDVGAGGSITVMNQAGTIIARHPQIEGGFGKDVSGSETARRSLATRAGQFTAASSVDGVERLFSFRGVGDLPLVVSVAVSVDGIYRAWWRKAVIIGSMLCALSGGTMALCMMFRREMLGRLHAERALLAAAGRLQVMASTDGLTGLANRRALNEGLDEAWQAAARTQTSLALLMIDADHFKAFNDAYGHPEGDRALQAVGGCISRCLRRPGELGARYGGEEFAALLPGLDSTGALAVAEAVRSAVLAAGIAHCKSPAGFVTVSIGVAVARPRFGEAAELLVREADAALYDAKRAGRNRVAMAGSGDAQPVL